MAISDALDHSRRGVIQKLGARLDRRFSISQRGSTAITEVLAGGTTFAGMAYIVAVNPTVMAQAGMDREDVAIATIIVSIVGSVATGLWANLPLGLAPSMWSNAFFSFVVVRHMGFPWPAALGIMLGSSLIILALGALHVREWMTNSIADDIKIGLQAAFGLFLCQIGLSQAMPPPAAWSAPVAPAIILTFVTLGTFVLAWRGVSGALIISVLLTWAIFAVLTRHGATDMVTLLSPVLPHWPYKTAFAINVSSLSACPLQAALALAFVTFNECVGLVATTVTVARAAHIEMSGKSARAAYVSDSLATLLGSLVGTATVSPYVESVAGVKTGGRTGLTALVAAAGFAATLFFIPLISAIPPAATTPTLLVLGVWMFCDGMKIALWTWARLLVVTTMVVITSMFGDLVSALAGGAAAYLIVNWNIAGAHRTTLVVCGFFVLAWAIAQRMP
ncbi:NCS2 family permease [Sphingomonas azotifigens]|uniref:NCS2 family permease n=1 Tax=Sphingomonas azotifigens TaxID=330920 RepID=UPI000A067045|nr:NCS2 family permease [Sphingomonas azotifigens]